MIRRQSQAWESLNSLISKNLALIRLERKLSRQELASKIGVSYQQLSKYEKGTNSISAVRLAMVSKVLKVPIESFFKTYDTELYQINHRNEARILKIAKSFTEVADLEQRDALYKLVKTMVPKKSEGLV